MRRPVLLWVGAGIVAVTVLTTALAPLLAPHDPTESVGAVRLEPPSRKHPMGTDQLRRDVLSRILYGGRVPLLVAFSSCALPLGLGTLLGWVSGYAGGRLDRLLSLLMDAVYAFPSLVLAIAIVAVLGPGPVNMVAAIAFVYVPTYFRVARSRVLVLVQQEFVEAARAVGATPARILLRHVAPNTFGAILTVPSFNVADAILTEAALAFLGFGVPPPTPDWGFDIQNGQKFLQSGHWWLITFPGAAIVLVSFGFGLLGEGLQEWLEGRPRRRHARR